MNAAIPCVLMRQAGRSRSRRAPKPTQKQAKSSGGAVLGQDEIGLLVPEQFGPEIGAKGHAVGDLFQYVPPPRR